MNMKIATSYFYQIRNLNSNMIPVSTALGDPAWYKPPIGKEYFVDKRGIICGLRYEPLIVQKFGTYTCPCDSKIAAPACSTMREYRQLLEDKVDFERTIKAFQFCADKFALPFDDEIIIVLMVHEAPDNPCSERWALQDYFTSHGWDCKELKYPIKENYN